MARLKDTQKRDLILTTAKRLFAAQGFDATSMAQIKDTCGLSTGSLYTYFASKDEILETIIEEGWQLLLAEVEASLAGLATPDQRIAVITDVFLPRLLDEADLIKIILSVPSVYSRLPEKLERIEVLIISLLGQDSPARRALNDPATTESERSYLRTSLIVNFLGILEASRLRQFPEISLTIPDLLNYTRRIFLQGVRGLE